MSTRAAALRGIDRIWPADGSRGLPWFAELLGVSGLLVAQPLFAVYADGADVFVWQRADDEIVWWSLALLLLPAVVLHLPARAVHRWWPTGGRALHAAALAVTAGALVARTFVHAVLDRGAGPPSTLLWVGLLSVGAGAAGATAAAWYRWAPFRTWLRMIALAPVALWAIFLLSSPVRDIAFAQGTGATVALDLDDPPPILLIVFDELPLASMLGDDDLIDADLLPGFARLAAQATLHRNVSTVSPSSPTAMPAMLTGTYPSAIDVPPIADEHPENLFTLLASTYRLNVWESVAQLCPPDRCSAGGAGSSVPALLGDAADVWWEGFIPDPLAEAEPYKPPQSQPSAPTTFASFQASLRASGPAQLDFLHVILPHQPWYHLPSGAQHDAPFLAPGLIGSTYRWADEFTAMAGRQRHLLQLVRTDQLLGDLIDQMEDEGTWDETLVIVTADHGAGFTAGEPIRGVSDGNHEQVMWVPLLIKEPGQRTAAVDDRPGRTIDLLPTIATLLGIDLPWEVDGVSLDADRPDDVEERRMLAWRFNELEPVDDGSYVVIDGVAAFDRLLALPPATDPGDDPLKPWRFGRWGGLIGTETSALEVTEPSSRTMVLHPPADTACHADRRRRSGVVPAYQCATTAAPAGIDVLFSVNGWVGGWGRTRSTKVAGVQVVWALVPDDLLEDDDVVELFEIHEDPAAVGGLRLAPIRLDED